METKTLTRRYWLIAILVTAAILRLYQIDQPFVDATSWRQSDTATIADNFYRGNWNIFYPEISWNGSGQNYVGYEFQTITYLAALLYRLLGQHDWIGRSIAILFGLWSIFALYQLLRRVWDEKHALVGAAVMAILPGGVYVDRSFVPDPVMVSLVLTSVWLLVAYLQTARLHYLLLASLIGMWGFLTKVSGIFIGIPMLYATLAILNHKQGLRSKQFVAVCIATVLTLIPVGAYYLWAMHISRTYPPYYIAAGNYWVWKFGLRHFLEQNYFLPRFYWQLKWFWTIPTIALVVVGLFLPPPQAGRDRESRQLCANEIGKAPWIFHWWLLGFGVYYLIAAQGLVENPTNLNIVNPAAAALAANSLVWLSSFASRKAGLAASFALIAVILLTVIGVGHKKLKDFALYPWAENGYKLGVALRQATQPTDLVITLASTSGDTVAVYYSQRRGWTFPPAYTGSTLDWSKEINDKEAIELLKELVNKGADWLGIVEDQKSKLWKENPQLVKYLEQTFERYQETPEFVLYRLPLKSLKIQ